MIALGVAHLTALELSPPQLVVKAAEVGFRSVGLRLNPAVAGGVAYPTRVGAQSQREWKGLLSSTGVRVREVEFIPLTPEVDVALFRGMLEAGADLGAQSVTVSGDDPDRSRLLDNFAAISDLAEPLGLRVEIEFMRWRVIGTLQQAASLVLDSGKSNAAVLLDALHLFRSGGTADEVARAPRGLIRSAQLCDARAIAPSGDDAIIDEARNGRLPPGQGALPLREFVAALPVEMGLSVEMPMPGLDAAARLKLAYASTQAFLNR